MTQATQLAPEADDEALLAADTLPASLGFDEAGPENCCPKCQAPGLGDSVEWCLKCGFYPRMGFHVEVDPQEDDFATAGMSPWDPRRIPAWAWFLTFGLLAILAESIAIRFIFPVGTLARALWAIGQCVLGCLIFAVVHLRAYLDAISDDAQITVMDILLRPLKTWAPTIHKLPATSKRVCLGAWSFAAAVMGPAVIGGIPYHLI